MGHHSGCVSDTYIDGICHCACHNTYNLIGCIVCKCKPYHIKNDETLVCPLCEGKGIVRE
jgi:hypothetical protein